MTLTTLDPTTALLVIDLQKGILALPGLPEDMPARVARNVELLEAFRYHGLPVVLVNVAGSPPGRTEAGRGGGALPEGWADLIPELNQQPGDLTVTKTSRGAFTTTELDAILNGLGVTQVVVSGVATGTGVEITASDAFERGYHVTLAVDAMADRNPETHERALAYGFPRIGESGTTAEIIALLAATR